MNLSSIQKKVSGISQRAGEKLREYASSASYTSYSKGGMDFVTEADLAIDTFVKDELVKNFPGIDVLTEETAGSDLLQYKNTEHLWIVDPIDGTTNFSRGDAHCAISIGLVTRGRPILGAVYLPLEEKYYEASLESDATCNGRRISVSDTTDLKNSSVGLDYSWDVSERKRTVDGLTKLLNNIRQPRSLGCASADICLVAEGRMDAYYNYGLKPWDTAAAGIILKKAGGEVSQVNGTPWDTFHSEFLGTNSHIHSEIVSLLS